VYLSVRILVSLLDASGSFCQCGSVSAAASVGEGVEVLGSGRWVQRTSAKVAAGQRCLFSNVENDLFGRTWRFAQVKGGNGMASKLLVLEYRKMTDSVGILPPLAVGNSNTNSSDWRQCADTEYVLGRVINAFFGWKRYMCEVVECGRSADGRTIRIGTRKIFFGQNTRRCG
jgi:hypothetical protein